MNNLNHTDQQVERALECVTLSEDAKYRVKNKIQSVSSYQQKHTGKKLSSASVFAITLVSLLVISAAAIGGLSYFKAIYGDKADTLSPYGVTIGTSTQNKDVILTLHESVADEYATAYIFSIKGLTDAGKALVASNTLDPNAYQTTFQQTNVTQEIYKDNKFFNEWGNRIEPEKIIIPEITDRQLFNLKQKTSLSEWVDLDIGLQCNINFEAVNNSAYSICPIDSLREPDCAYYALYIINPEAQLTLTFDGLELQLPEAKMHIPGNEITINGYIQDYFLTEGGLSRLMSEYPVSAVLTPLGLYVQNGGSNRDLMYKNATLVLSDGSEVELRELSNEQISFLSPNKHYGTTDNRDVVYLFRDIMDVTTVKSLVFYDDIEFPFDGRTPFVRSNGRVLIPDNNSALVWDISEQIRDYVDLNCPVKYTVKYNPYKSQLFSGWSSVNYVNDESVGFYRYTKDNIRDADFTISLTEKTGGTLEEEARIMLEKMNVKYHDYGYKNNLTFNVTKTGVYNDIDVLVVECGESQPGLYKRCIFSLYEGKLLTIEYNGYTGQPTDYAFDALLDLITF